MLNSTEGWLNALYYSRRNAGTLCSDNAPVWRRLESALIQPRMTFGGEELYPTIIEKASALGYSIIKNHPFIDGNKRAGHAAMEVFLVLNGFEISASIY